MLEFYKFSDDGRTLKIEFKCGRCGKSEIEDLKTVFDRSGDVQRYLSSLRVPRGWEDCYPFPILCPECKEGLKLFFKGGMSKMRKILFRGQTRRKGQKVWMDGTPVDSNWVYGGIFQGIGDHSIIYGEDHMEFSGVGLGKHIVYTDTIGEYTGVQDKSGTYIFEGDIVLVLSSNFDEEDGYAIVSWDDKTARFILEWYGLTSDFDHIYGEQCEVVGNIYDNRELDWRV